MARARSQTGSFYEVLTAAVTDVTEHGYDSQDRVDYWVEELRRAAIRSLTPPLELEQALKRVLTTTYEKLVDRGGILRMHRTSDQPARFTLQHVKPKLRGELDRRIMASANLIKLNREQAISDTLRRFSGWSTSIPPGGSETVDKNKVKREARKPLAQLPFIERRVLIDQGHKFTSELNNILATAGNAIAAEWNSNWRQVNYNYRKDHKERDEHVYAIRGNWAMEKGLMKAGPDGYTDQITKPAEEPFCRCFYRYIYNIRDLPSDMVTEKGRESIKQVRAA